MAKALTHGGKLGGKSKPYTGKMSHGGKLGGRSTRSTASLTRAHGSEYKHSHKGQKTRTRIPHTPGMRGSSG